MLPQLTKYNEVFQSLIVLFFQLCSANHLFAQKQNSETYILHPNDLIRVEIFQEPELSGPVRILRTGEASFPLIGSVNLSGLTIENAAEKIRSLYEADYLVDPKLTLTIDEYATELISVIGAVRTPGLIPIPASGKMDLTTALATVGGLTETADSNEIELIRSNGAKITFSHNAIVNGESGKTQLQAGDRIIVKNSPYLGKTVTIIGQIAKQGELPFPLNGKLDILSAIARAGGPSNLANLRKITINRNGVIIPVDYEQYAKGTQKPLLLIPGDLINIPERYF